MPDFASTMADDTPLTEEEQKKAGQALSGKMQDDHKKFLEHLIGLIDSGEMNPLDPQTFLNTEIYEKLGEQWKEKTDLALMNIANQVQMISEFYHSSETPDESPQLDTMVEQLMQMVGGIEEGGDIFKF